MAEITLKIDGMSCQHCVMSVKKALEAIDGVRSSVVVTGSATVDVDDPAGRKAALIRAVQDAGYKVVD